MKISKFNSFYYEAAFSASATAYFNQVTSNGGSLTNAEKTYINTFIGALGTDFAEFDRLWIHGLSNSVAARTSLANPTSTMITAVNSPTFTASQGFTGNGSTSYLNHNVNENALTKYTQNSNSIFVYSRSNISEAKNEYGVYDGSNITANIINSSSIAYTANNMNIANVAFGSNTNSLGLFFSKRVATALTSFKNGVSLFTNTIASTPLCALQMYSLARNQSGAPNSNSTKQHAAIGYGSGSINQATFYTALQALGTSIGWAV